MARLLVCPPQYFGIEYEINPWMRMSDAADPQRAKQQWDELMGILENDMGATLEKMSPIPGLPDLVFTANAGIVSGSVAVPSRFRHPERQREEEYFTNWFQTHGYNVTLLDREYYFEGAGDLLGWSKIWFGGYRQRSDVRSYSILSDIFKREILTLELIDPAFYHLDTCFCPLSGGELLYFPAAFDAYALKTIENQVPQAQQLVVPPDEAKRFACNAVCIHHKVVLPEGCPKTSSMLTDRGYHVYSVNLDQFLKAGGAAKCLTLRLDEN